ncbi:MAG: tetratricopeptide repeat protein [Balneolales bacterium]|nr:tetratricopeptide repeat protein [Balneolales bacterium]
MILFVFQSLIGVVGSLFLFNHSGFAQQTGFENFHLQQGIAQYEMGDPEGAIESLEWALEEDDTRPETYLYLSSAYLLSDRPNDAAAIAKRGIGMFPEVARLYVIKGEALARFDIPAIIPLYEALEDLLNQEPEQEQDGITLAMVRRSLGAIYEQTGSQLYLDNNPVEAVSFLEKAIVYTPESQTVHNNLAFILIELERFEDAVVVLDAALSRFPDTENLILLRAQAAGQLGEGDEVVRMLKKLYDQNPADHTRGISYAIALFNNNQPNDANTLFQELLERFPEERSVYEALLNINRQRMDVRGVNRVLELKTRQFPEDVDVARQYGQSYISLRAYDRAYALFDSLATGLSSPEFGRLAAHALLYDEAWDDAVTYYIKLLGQFPEYHAIKREAGLLLDSQGDTESAQSLYEAYASISGDGRFWVKAAQLTEDEGERALYLQEAGATSWRHIAKWLSGTPVSWARDENAGQMVEMVDGIIRMYSSIQQQTERQAGQDLEILAPSVPELFGFRAELHEVEGFIHDALDVVSKKQDATAAVRTFEELMHRFSDSPLLFYYKGRMFERLGETEEALEWMRESVRLGAGGPEVHLRMASLHRQADQTDLALLAYERALTLDNQNRTAYRGLVDLSQEADRLDELADRWLPRSRNDPQNLLLRDFLIETLHKAGRLEEARELLP